MSEEKKESKLEAIKPVIKEVGGMASKLFKDIKTSVCEIIADYKEKHPVEKKSSESNSHTASSQTSAVNDKEEQVSKAETTSEEGSAASKPNKEDSK